MKKKWLDFSAYGLKLQLAKTPSRHYLVLGGPDVMNHVAAAAAIKYKTVGASDQILIRGVQPMPDGTLSVAEHPNLATYQRAFPNIVEVDYDPEIHFRDQSQTKLKEGGPVEMQGERRTLGLNRSGHEVVEAENGRFIKMERSKLMAEADSGGGSPGMFLRAKDADSLAACADGFVEEAYGRNKVLRADDFKRFYEVVTSEKADAKSERYAEVRRAVEAATARAVVRKGGTSMASAFIAAHKIVENLAFLGDGRGAPNTGPSGPVAVAAQRLLGTEANLKGKRVVLVNPGYGHALSHLPRTVDLRLAGNVQQAEVTAMLKTCGMRAETVTEGTSDLMACEAQIADLPRTTGKPVETPAGAMRRADLATAIGLLGQRDDDGNTTLVLDAPSTPEEEKDFEAFRDHVSQNYAFDGEARVDGSLWRGRPDAPAKLILSVGWRRPRPQPAALPPEVRDVRDWTALWTWTTEVVTSRTQIETGMEETADPVTFTAGVENRNEYQVPYVSASRSGTPTTMVPRNLEGATREALGRIVNTYGAVDAFVAKEYGYEEEELHDLFSPEQIDALALAVHAENRDRGFLIADQMGVGKGRTLAAVMRRAILKEGKVLFTTEKQTNLSDIWRDIVHTKSDHLFRPMVLNNGASIIDEKTKEVVLRTAPVEDIEAMLESGKWPEGFNAVFSTYSQFKSEVPSGKGANAEEAPARRASPLARAQWLATAIGKDTKLVLDECHNAASGESNVSKNLTMAVKQAGGITFSSATFAHKAKHMAFYAPLLPDGMSAEDLSMMLERGGETFQEVLSGMLVHDGVMIRREFDLSKIQFRTVLDSERLDRNCAYMDAVAPILSEIMSLTADVDDEIKQRNAALEPGQADAGAANGGRRRKRRPSGWLTKTGYGTPLYTISRLFVASLKVDIVAEEAIACLRDNEKPVILVENTVQSLLEEVAERDGDVDANDGMQAPDFGALFGKVLRQATRVRVSDGAGSTQTADIAESTPALQAKVDRIRRMFADVPHLPISAIDEVKRRIDEAGFTCGEITGRTLAVQDGRVVRRPVPNATVVKNDFNGGALDAIVINTAGSTGIDLHASARFEDSRPRHLFELQAPADIVRKIQAHGRINRYDQIHDPKITGFLTGLPVEMRLAAMENAKLRRLSANTTSNRDAAVLTRGIPDLINPIGDVVCSRYAEARPDLIRRLGFRVSDIDQKADENRQTEAANEDDLRKSVKQRKQGNGYEVAKTVGDNHRTANEILSRLIMLPVAVQKKVCTELTAEFYAAVEELEARGETPLKTHELPGLIHVKKGPDGKPVRSSFEGADVETPDSVFNEPLYVMDAALERTETPIKGDVLLQMVSIGEMASGRLRPCVDRLRTGIDEVLAAHLPEGVATVEEALARNHPKIVNRKRNLDLLVETLETLKPGSAMTYTVDGQAVEAIVTKVDYPERGFEHVPGIYGVEFVVAGDVKPRTMRLETLMRDEGFKVGPGLAAEDYDPILKKYDDSVHVRLTSVKLLVNNVYRGMKLCVEHGLGSLRTYRTKDDNVVHRGIVVSSRFHGLHNIPVEITGTQMAIAAVNHGIDLVADAKLNDKNLSIRDMGGDTVEIRLPPRSSRKWGFVYDDGRMQSLLRRDISGGKGPPRVQVTKNELKDHLDALHLVGARFWAGPLHRTWANGWLAKNQAQLAPPAPEMPAEEPQVRMIA